MSKALPHAFYRLYPQRGEADCTIASMATIFRRDLEEVLVAAALISKTVWRSGLTCPEMVRVAKKLGIKVKWHVKFDVEDGVGVLWVSHHDTTKEHCVALIDGWVFDPAHNPISMAPVEDYYKAFNAFGNSLLQVVE